MFTELWSDLRYRLRAIFRRGAMDRELAEELRSHLQHEAAKHERAGVAPNEAMRRARLALGGVERVKDDTRDARAVSFFNALAGDVRYAVRGLRARPGFTAAVAITLGLGIGVNAAMFGVLDRLLLRAPDYLIDPSRVHRVYLGSMERGQLRQDRSIEYLRYTNLSGWTTSFDAAAAFAYRQMAVGAGDDLSPQFVGVVSASYFDFFTARPIVGRFFTRADDSPQGNAVAVITDAYWQAHYARAEVVGQTITIQAKSYAIIGVAPKGFDGISDQQTPIAFIPITPFAMAVDARFAENYGWSWLDVVMRRKAGVAASVATADLTNAYQRSWNAERAMGSGGPPVTVARPRVILGDVQLGRGPLAGPEARVVVWMSAVALIVLLIACANVANLLLVRSMRRRRELAVRTALGGSRSRIIQQLLIETGVLAIIGGVVGLAAAQWGGGALRRAFLQSSGASDVVADGRTLLFALGATLGAAFIAGLAPAFQSGSARMADSLKAGSRELGYTHSRARSVLLVLQAALSVVLLVGAGLFMRSLGEVRAVRLGYDVDPLLVVPMNLRGSDLKFPDIAALFQRLDDELRATPGVENVTRAVTVPFFSSEGRGLFVPGVDSVRRLGRFALQVASPEYFVTMGTRILRGRGITADDRQGAPRVGLVSEAMANVLWPGRDPIGQCFKVGADTMPCTTVVGVAENIKTRSLTGEPEFHYYLSAAQFQTNMVLIGRVRGKASDFAETIRRRLQHLMPGSTYVATIPMTTIMEPHVRSWKAGATMFLAFGMLALALAAIGLYAVIAFAVTQRTHELGLRIALGARTRDVLRLVIGEGIGLALAGVVIGFGIALTAGSRVSPLLYHVSGRDPATYGIVGGLLVVVAAVASAVPAMRAARVDPNVALRSE